MSDSFKQIRLDRGNTNLKKKKKTKHKYPYAYCKLLVDKEYWGTGNSFPSLCRIRNWSFGKVWHVFNDIIDFKSLAF